MSAWIVENESLNNIVNSFFWRRNNEHLNDILKRKFDINLSCSNDKELNEELSKFGQILADLNNDSINQRYDETNDAIEFKLLDKKAVSIYQFLKSVECYTYQSCEGDCDQTELYKFLIELEESLRHEIINEIEEYKNAKWE